jgi:hypothetical protein
LPAAAPGAINIGLEGADMTKSRTHWLVPVVVASLVALCLVALSGSALAQEAPTATAVGSGPVPIGRMRLSFSVVPAPLGSVETTVPIIGHVSADTAVAFGLRPAFDYSINDYFFVGFAPQFLLNVKGDDSNGSAGKALDLQLRIGGHAPVADRVHLYGYLAPGYSIIFPPSGNDNATGFVLGVAVGAMYAISDKLFAAADIGYQLGYQEYTFQGADFDFHLRYLLIGLGIGMRL